MDENHERRRELMAENRLAAGKFQKFDRNSRIYKRTKIDGENYLVLISEDGEVILLSENFERHLVATLKHRFD